MQPRFKVGDIVHIVNQPVKMAAGWAYDMNECCGQEVMIKSIHADSFGVCSTDPNSCIDFAWSWNIEAFQEFYVDPVVVSDDDLLSLLEVV